MDTNYTYGWIRLSRSITEIPGYFDEPFCRAQCLIDLYILAEWKPTRSFYIRGNLVTLHRGQVAVSIRDLSERWRLGVNTVIRRLKEFEQLGNITVKRSKLINIITICNYNDNHSDCKAVECNNDGQADTQTTTQTTTQTLCVSKIDNESPQQTDTQTEIQIETQTETLSLKIKERKQEKERQEPSLLTQEGKGPGQEALYLFDYFFAGKSKYNVHYCCNFLEVNLDQLKALFKGCLISWQNAGRDFSGIHTDPDALLCDLLQSIQSRIFDDGRTKT